MKRKILVSALVSIGLVLTTLAPMTSAVTGGGGSASTGTHTLEDLAYVYSAYWFMNACGDAWANTISADDAATNLKWFTRSNISNSGHLLSGAGNADCNNGADWLKRSLAALGYPTNTGFLEAIGYKREADGGYKMDSKDVKGNVTQIFEVYLGGSVADVGNRPELNYWINYRNFTSGCSAQKTGLKSTLTQDAWTGDGKYVIYGPETVDEYVYSGKGAGTMVSTGYRDGSSNDGSIQSCRDLSELLHTQQGIDAYRKYMINNENNAPLSTGQGSATQSGQSPGSSTSTCAIDGVGWIVCPVMNFLAKISDEAHKKLDSLMTIDAESIFNTEDKPGNVYSYWKVMRNYANIAFIIAFMVIIYSQITSAGISNYGIKKMLPKLIVVAMLVNVSFMICALAVDISNFLGVSLTNFISGVGPTGAAKSSEWATGASGFQNITGKVLVATAAGVVAYFALASVAGMLIFVVIASVTVLFILGLRQALIILLVVVSPLAFVAYLLPNTEGLFKKWWTMFKSLLLIYPIVGLLYGAGKLASGVLGNSDDILVQSVAGFLLFAPTLLAYILLKGVLNNFGSLGQMVGKFQGKTSGAANKKFQSKLGESTYGLNKDFRKRERMKSAALARGGQYSGGNLLRKGRSWIANKTNPMMGDFGRNLSNTGAGIASKEDDEDMKNAHARVTSTRHSDGSVLSQKDRMELAMGRDLKDKKTGKVLVSASDTHARRAAVEQAASVASVGELSQLVDASRNWEDASVRKSLASSIPQSSAGKKAPWLGGETIGDVEQGSASTAKAISKALLGGKITAETLASSDAATVTQLYDHALSTPPGSKERDILRQAEATLRGNNELAAKVASGGEHDSILSSMKSL